MTPEIKRHIQKFGVMCKRLFSERARYFPQAQELTNQLIISTMETYEFDFYQEVRKNFKNLLPRKEATLAIFILYQKISLNILEAVFSHDNILEAINQAFEDQGKTNRQKSPVRDNDIIHELMPFFIRKESRGYSLRGYAYELCKLIEGELQNRFNPSQIEIQFKIFYQALQDHLQTEKQFVAWYEVTFDKSKNPIKRQLEILHNSVDEAINELNVMYHSESVDFANKLREMDSKVKGLGSDTKQLASAFQLVDDIMTLINQAYSNPTSFAYSSNKFREIRKEIKSFFAAIEHALSEVSFSVDKVKPQLERLYGSFEQRELDRKLEKLVQYAFKNAVIQKNQLKEEIVLPKNVPLHVLSIARTRFLYPFYFNFVEQTSPDFRDTTYNIVSHLEQFAEVKAQVELNKKAVGYFNQVMAKINSEPNVEYDEYFFDLIKNESNLEIALKTTHLVLREMSKMPEYKIHITPRFKVSEHNKNIAIWETRLRNLNS